MAKRKSRISLRSGSEVDGLREAGRFAAEVLNSACEAVRPGVTTGEIDQIAAHAIAKLGCKSAFLGYRGYPGNICISVNEEVVHGIGGTRVLKDGDIVKIDVGVSTPKGWIGDNAKSVSVGELSSDAESLLASTEASLYAAIAAAKQGVLLSVVCAAVEGFVSPRGYSVVREFVGHGVGRKLHEEPQVPNYWEVDSMRARGFANPRLEAGMVLAIEPMVNAGGPEICILDDQWTVITRDQSLSAHFEHTVLITDHEAEILTPRERSFASPAA